MWLTDLKNPISVIEHIYATYTPRMAHAYPKQHIQVFECLNMTGFSRVKLLFLLCILYNITLSNTLYPTKRVRYYWYCESFATRMHNIFKYSYSRIYPLILIHIIYNKRTNQERITNIEQNENIARTWWSYSFCWI